MSLERDRPWSNKRRRLFTEIAEENDCDDDSDSSEGECEDGRSESTDGSSSIDTTGAHVYLRLKPVDNPSAAYTLSKEGNVLITGPPSDSSCSSNNKNAMEKHYSFSAIFDASVDQREVYEKCIGQKIETAENLAVLTYGTSGSGKTFTLLGDAFRPGVIPRSLENIFRLYQLNIYPYPFLKIVNGSATFLDDNAAVKENILRCRVINSCPELEGEYANLRQSIAADHDLVVPDLDTDLSVLIWVSFVEIYNEYVYDLLEPLEKSNAKNNTNRKNLKIVCNDGRAFIKGLTSVYVKDSQEALRLLRWGLQKLTYASTAINENSSRSHCIFFVDVIKYYRSGVIAETSYKFCDLAGSERLDKTGSMGSRLKETQSINTSLMVLGRCIDAANNGVTRKNERIPFRESKLTMLLQSVFLGKEKLAMIVNVTPTDKYYEENLKVLSFASIARNIVFKLPVVKQNQSRYSMFGDKPDGGYIQELLEEKASRRSDMEKLRNEIQQLGNERQQLLEENASLRSDMEKLHQHGNERQLLLEENASLRSDMKKLLQQHDEVVKALRNLRKQLVNQHTDELAKLEHEIRIELVTAFQKTLDENQKQFEMRLQTELNSEKRIYDFMKKKYEDEVVDERIALRNDRRQPANHHTEELAKLEHEIRHEFDTSFQKTLDENQKQFEMHLQTELNSQKRIYKSRIEFMKRKFVDEIERGATRDEWLTGPGFSAA